MGSAKKVKAGIPQVIGGKTFRLLAVLALLSTLPAAVSASLHCDEFLRTYRQNPLIVVATKDCAGNDGLASFRGDRVFRIVTGNCRDPDDSDQPLYQVMLRTLTGNGNYDAIWVDSAGMQSIQEQLEENRQAELQRRECSRSAEGPVDESQD